MKGFGEMHPINLHNLYAKAKKCGLRVVKNMVFFI